MQYGTPAQLLWSFSWKLLARRRVKNPDIKKAAPKIAALKTAAPKKAVSKVYPTSYAGKWIAWTPDCRTIVASASSVRKVQSLAMRKGYPRAVLERVPRNLEPILGDDDL